METFSIDISIERNTRDVFSAAPIRQVADGRSVPLDSAIGRFTS
jgi:hypothetical protein